MITRGDTAKRAAAANAQETTRVLVEIERLIGPAGTTSTPVEPGTIEVEARVLVTFEVSSAQP